MKIGEFTEKKVLKLAKEAYEKGDVEFDIIPDKCALIVIDMQNEFVILGSRSNQTSSKN